MTGVGARGAARIAALLAGLGCLLVLCLATAPARAAPTLQTAFTDDVWLDGGPSWIPRTVATRARLVLLELDWASAEPSPPPAGANASDPSGGQFDFSKYDQVVRAFAGSGISVALLVTDAPRWAEAPGGPVNFESAGAWKPSPTALAAFASALAQRYSGTYPDPVNPGQVLPRVKYFQAWAEANFSVHLAPQWTRTRHGWSPTGPALYRNLLNAFYAAVKRVHPDNFVITTGFGPYGDPPGGCPGSQGVGNGCRMRPALFARELLCLHGQALSREACANPAHFDALAADPYQVLRPTTPAYNADDVSSADIWKLRRILSRAIATRRALPRGRKQLWVTEFSYDSKPPNPSAVSLATQARWLDEALYLFWKQGVSTAVWYLVRDQAPTYNSTDYYSGVYYFGGQAKPSFEAFRFPFLIWPAGRAATAWGIAPASGALTVQRRRGRSWSTVFRTHVSAGGVFVHSVPARLRGSFRALVNGESSLVWSR